MFRSATRAIRFSSVALPAALLALAIAAPADAQPRGQQEEEGRATCVNIARVHGWNVVDRRTIELQAGASRRYLVTLGVAADTVGLRSATRIGLVPDSTGRLCALGGEVLADGRRIQVTHIERVDEPAA